jgi:hypothetical protein
MPEEVRLGGVRVAVVGWTSAVREDRSPDGRNKAGKEGWKALQKPHVPNFRQHKTNLGGENETTRVDHMKGQGLSGWEPPCGDLESLAWDWAMVPVVPGSPVPLAWVPVSIPGGPSRRRQTGRGPGGAGRAATRSWRVPVLPGERGWPMGWCRKASRQKDGPDGVGPPEQSAMPKKRGPFRGGEGGAGGPSGWPAEGGLHVRRESPGSVYRAKNPLAEGELQANAPSAARIEGHVKMDPAMLARLTCCSRFGE